VAKAGPAPEVSEALKEIDLGTERLLGIAIIGRMEITDYDRLNTLIEEQATKYGKARIMLEIVTSASFSGKALMEDLKTSVKQYKNVERMAIVGDQSWLKTTVRLSDLLTRGWSFVPLVLLNGGGLFRGWLRLGGLRLFRRLRLLDGLRPFRRLRLLGCRTA